MNWEKKGLIYCPDGTSIWAKHSALNPTPYFISDDIIRIFVGFRDENGVSRVGYVDVRAENPSSVVRISEKPVLDIGVPGAFDENGVAPCAVIRNEKELYLYYAGYQLGQKVRFYVFGGLAKSQDGGESFTRSSQVPVLERSDEGLLFRVIHTIMFDDDLWKIWYGAGSKFIQGDTKTLPVYNIRYMESHTPTDFKGLGQTCIDVEGGDEYRVARPYVMKEGKLYRMFYSVGTKTKSYRLGYAESDDGINWSRKDSEMEIDVSESGWDSKMVAYPSVVKYKDRAYLFYDGNDYGRDGFGYAVLRE